MRCEGPISYIHQIVTDQIQSDFISQSGVCVLKEAAVRVFFKGLNEDQR